jgi:hypothetical protein
MKITVLYNRSGTEPVIITKNNFYLHTFNLFYIKCFYVFKNIDPFYAPNFKKNYAFGIIPLKGGP